MTQVPTSPTGPPARHESMPPRRPGATPEATRDGPGRGVRRTVAIAAVAGVLALAASGVAVQWARGDGDNASNPASRPSDGTVVPIRAPSEATTPSTTAETAASAPAPAGPVLDDGRHPAILTRLDVADRTIEFDLIQFLTGDEALAAFEKDHPDEPEGWANDYYIVNDNPRLRTLRVARDVEVTVVRTDESAHDAHWIPFDELPAYLASEPVSNDERVGHNPFWLTVRGDTVVAIEEQFLP
jgi:hypothetical protein